MSLTIHVAGRMDMLERLSISGSVTIMRACLNGQGSTTKTAISSITERGI